MVDFFVMISSKYYVYLVLFDNGDLVIYDNEGCRSFYSEKITQFVKQPCNRKVYIEFSDGYEIIIENDIFPTITLLNRSPIDAEMFFSDVNIKYNDYTDKYTYANNISFCIYHNFRLYKYEKSKKSFIEIVDCEKSIQEAIDSKRILCDDVTKLELVGILCDSIFLYTLNNKIISSTPEYTQYNHIVLSYDILKREETYIEINKEYIDFLWRKGIYYVILPSNIDPFVENTLIQECCDAKYGTKIRPFKLKKFCGDILTTTKFENGIVTIEITKLEIAPEIFDNFRSKTVKSARSVIN